jgi:succinate dehydrogenase / fumarate reductase cytochrome b subunit
MEIAKNKRPVYLNLVKIRLPLPGFVSILHRISGALLFLSIPVLLCWLQSSLSSAESYSALKQTFSHPVLKIFLLILLWGYLHHFFAGIRFLLLDLHKGIALPRARLGAAIVLVISLTLTLILGVRLW